jgi:CBS domain containing-hemolysin-like protein
MSLINLLVIVSLLLFAGFLAGSESALTSLSRVLVEEIVEVNPKYSKKFSKLLENPARYLNVLLLVRKGCELTATVFVADYAILREENNGFVLVGVVLLMLAISYVIVGVGPRTLGKQHAISWARPAIFTADILAKLLGPVTNLLIAIGNAITPGRGFKSGPFCQRGRV